LRRSSSGTTLDTARLIALVPSVLSWRTSSLTVFCQAGGAVLVLWGREKLAADSGVDPGHAGGFGGIVLAHNVGSRAEVDEIVDAAERAGATVTRPASETFYGGYAACFADPDGHLWEVAHNPGFTLAGDGSLILPDFGEG
jgi:catechol 2,3-dioxygenase-like lactoylglutathione lyase family enzyme